MATKKKEKKIAMLLFVGGQEEINVLTAISFFNESMNRFRSAEQEGHCKSHCSAR